MSWFLSLRQRSQFPTSLKSLLMLKSKILIDVIQGLASTYKETGIIGKQLYQNLLTNLIFKILDLFFFCDPTKIEIFILILNCQILAAPVFYHSLANVTMDTFDRKFVYTVLQLLWTLRNGIQHKSFPAILPRLITFI